MRVLPVSFLKGIRDRQIQIFKELAFQKVASFGANNRDHFIPFLKAHLPNQTIYHTSCRHPCSFYNSAAVPTDDAYDDLDSLCEFIAPSQSYGTKLRSEQGPDLAVRQALRSAANSAAGKIGGKISMAKMSVESKAKGGKIGGKNKPAHKDGVWYDAYCDNPNCVEKTADGNGKLGKSKVGTYPSRHQYSDENGKTTNCGKGTRGLGYYRIRI